MLTHVVQKSFKGSGHTYRANECVDATHWKRVRLLEDQRYIRPLRVGEKPVKAKGRYWLPGAVPLRLTGGQRSGPPPKKRKKKAKKKGQQAATEYPDHLGFGRWKLSNGDIFRGKREAAEQAEKELAGAQT